MDRTTLMRKRKTKNPCPTCFMHLERCICAHIPRLSLKTKVSLIVHHKELKRTTNTGRLALHALTNSSMHIRGEGRQRMDLSHLLSPDYETYVLYPSAEAIDLEALTPQKPVHLLVADGNWRQAGKVNQRHPEFRHLPRVRVRPTTLAQYHLRQEHFQDGLSTIEAIALAIGTLEGKNAQNSLLALYQAKLHATLKGRGIC